ncbi:MAG: T9SS type A sorting domain-containing protein [Bacteroidota bacterium]
MVFTSLAFRPTDGQLYVAFQDYDAANYLKATVMRFDGVNWVFVGYAGFSAGEIAYPSFAFSPDGDPFIAYGDQAYSRNATVMKFDGSIWKNVGTPGFSTGVETWQNSIAFSPSGVLYMAYKERGLYDSCAVNVVKFDSVLAGQKELSRPGSSLYPNPAASEVTVDLTPVHGNVLSFGIFDVRGVKMFETRPTGNKLTIRIDSYPAGIYLVKIKTTDENYLLKFCKI